MSISNLRPLLKPAVSMCQEESNIELGTFMLKMNYFYMIFHVFVYKIIQLSNKSGKNHTNGIYGVHVEMTCIYKLNI